LEIDLNININKVYAQLICIFLNFYGKIVFIVRIYDSNSHLAIRDLGIELSLYLSSHSSP